MRTPIKWTMLAAAVVTGALLAGCSSSTDDGTSSATPSSAGYSVSTSAPNATSVSWAGVGTTPGANNARSVAVPDALVGAPAAVCWRFAGDSNSLGTADGTDETSQALGHSIPSADAGNLTGSGCAHSVTLSSYIAVTPSGDWALSVAAEAPAKSSSKPSASKPAKKKKKHHPKPSKTAASSSTPADDATSSDDEGGDSCYPLTNGGNCYEPGEFCRHSDEGVEGRSGSGEAIVCEDNNGLRWEPA